MRLALWLLIASLAGCALGSARPDRSTFFALAASEPDGAVPAGSWDAALGLGPVAIPGYLDRPQLVTRVGPNELKLAPVARWAEPLREGIGRALQQDLAAASGARQVALYPWPPTTHVDLAVAVDVLRFEPGARGDIELAARWSVRDTVHGRVLAVRESRLLEPLEGAGYGAEVAALSRALGQLAHEMAAALREVKLFSR
jgi:hypothetical protein